MLSPSQLAPGTSALPGLAWSYPCCCYAMLLQLIQEDMVAYLIASDISDVAELEDMGEEVFTEWLASKPEEQRYGTK
jgi:hypothetical protein